MILVNPAAFDYLDALPLLLHLVIFLFTVWEVDHLREFRFIGLPFTNHIFSECLFDHGLRE